MNRRQFLKSIIATATAIVGIRTIATQRPVHDLVARYEGLLRIAPEPVEYVRFQGLDHLISTGYADGYTGAYVLHDGMSVPVVIDEGIADIAESYEWEFPSSDEDDDA